MTDGTSALACVKPTAKFPEGRTGTAAGYGAHRAAGESACKPCTEAHSARCAERGRSLAPDELARRREQLTASAQRWRDREREAGRANETERRYRERQRELGTENAARVRFQVTNREIIRAAKERPCTDCGIAYPYYVMQFDHRGDAKKEFNIGQTGPTVARPRLLAEIAKCDVVCGNCHAERTHQRVLRRRQAREAVS